MSLYYNSLSNIGRHQGGGESNINIRRHQKKKKLDFIYCSFIYESSLYFLRKYCAWSEIELPSGNEAYREPI